MDYEYHEFANIFPLIEGNEFEELKKDIKEQGLQQTIILYEGQILDGRNRYRACKDIGIEPRFEEYKGTTPLQFVISLNLKRRHLNASQRATFALITLPLFEAEARKRQGTRTDLKELTSVDKSTEVKRATKELGKTWNVDWSYINDAKKLQKEHPEVIEAIKKGDKTITEVKSELKVVARKEKIAKQREELKKENPKLPKGKFEVIVVDPPWDYGTEENYNPEGFRGTAPYPEMTIEQIKDIKLPASDNCIVWLWTTHKFIFECREILKSWGFRDVSVLTWVKNKMGIGKWLRSKSEYCVMAVKGTPTINLTNQTTVLLAPNAEHSVKPQEFYDMVEELCIGRKLDYFARKKREGWDVFGDEVNKEVKV